jgi:hypothetical protein
MLKNKKPMEIKDELLDIEGIKKSSKTLLDLFIRRTAVLTSTPEFMVEKIIKDQWKNANKKTQPDSDIAELDFPNLGSFYISSAKAKKRIKRVEKHHDELVLAGPVPGEREEKKRVDKINIDKKVIREIKFKTKQL